MKTKLIITLVFVLLFLSLIITVICMGVELSKSKLNNIAAESNYNVAVGKIDSLKLQNGTYQKTVSALSVKLAVLKHDNSKMAQYIKQTIKASEIRLKQLQTIINYQNSISVNLKDSSGDIVLVDTISAIDNMIVHQYNDKWINFQSSCLPETDICNYIIRITSEPTIIKSRYREGFILFRWLKKWKYHYNIKDENPYSNIGNISVVEVY